MLATSQGHAYTRFRRYLDAGQVTNALATADELHRIPFRRSGVSHAAAITCS
jgi:hypothetical protein